MLAVIARDGLVDCVEVVVDEEGALDVVGVVKSVGKLGRLVDDVFVPLLLPKRENCDDVEPRFFFSASPLEIRGSIHTLHTFTEFGFSVSHPRHAHIGSPAGSADDLDSTDGFTVPLALDDVCVLTCVGDENGVDEPKALTGCGVVATSPPLLKPPNAGEVVPKGVGEAAACPLLLPKPPPNGDGVVLLDGERALKGITSPNGKRGVVDVAPNAGLGEAPPNTLSRMCWYSFTSSILPLASESYTKSTVTMDTPYVSIFLTTLGTEIPLPTTAKLN